MPIDPTADDIGRRVVYRSQYQPELPEEGTITSFNDHYVFVRYSGTTSAATYRHELEWISQ